MLVVLQVVLGLSTGASGIWFGYTMGRLSAQRESIKRSEAILKELGK